MGFVKTRADTGDDFESYDPERPAIDFVPVTAALRDVAFYEQFGGAVRQRRHDASLDIVARRLGHPKIAYAYLALIRHHHVVGL